jgi:hypothetical protein
MRAWDRVFWAIRFTRAMRGDMPMLLGTAWHKEANERNKGYVGEPSRTLLFKTRKHARQYCAAQMASYAARGDVCSKWKFTPVRVRELIEPFTSTSAGDQKS